jgi:hypothetical protein
MYFKDGNELPAHESILNQNGLKLKIKILFCSLMNRVDNY